MLEMLTNTRLNKSASMKGLTALVRIALFIAAMGSMLYAQSLADLAKQEKERRKEVQDAKVITGEDAARYRTQTTEPAAEQPAVREAPEKNGSAEKAKPGTADPDEPVDFEGRPESYWRKTMAEARQRVADLEKEATALVLKINSLQTQFYNEDDPYKREGIGRELNKSFYEQDTNKEELAKAKDVLQDLEKEARKSGALPGWLR